VALWEALVGERPFEGDTVASLMHSVRSGQFKAPALDRDVSPAVLRALRRGLSAEPEQRWPSMDALLTALAVDPSLDPSAVSRSRRRVAFALLAAGFVCTVLSAVALAGGERVTLALTLLPPLAVLAAVGLLALALRRTLLRQRYHRRVIAVLVVALTSSTYARALGWMAGMAAPELLLVDFVAMVGVGTMGALFVARWFVVVVPMSLVAALLVALVAGGTRWRSPTRSSRR
jgi:hypothetical protein